MCKKCLNSFLPFLPAPSAIFDGTETADRRICDVNPYISSLGKLAVALYMSVTNSMLLIQIFKSLCVFIFLCKNMQIFHYAIYLPLALSSSCPLVHSSTSSLLHFFNTAFMGLVNLSNNRKSSVMISAVPVISWEKVNSLP